MIVSHSKKYSVECHCICIPPINRNKNIRELINQLFYFHTVPYVAVTVIFFNEYLQWIFDKTDRFFPSMRIAHSIVAWKLQSSSYIYSTVNHSMALLYYYCEDRLIISACPQFLVRYKNTVYFIASTCKVPLFNLSDEHVDIMSYDLFTC